MERLASWAVDTAILAGAGSITYGVWLLSHPASFIVGGVLLIGGGWAFARRGI